MTSLILRDVHVTIGTTPVVTGVSLTAPSGGRVGIVGPNGSGKSTLLRAVYRHLPLAGGSITVGGEDLWALTPRRAAQLVAALPQETRSDFDVTVWEMAAMGRTPHKRPFAADTERDVAVVADALAHAGVAHLAGRRFTTLSGGERQRVLLARALAQQAPVLVLDEPTNHLDVRHQFDLLGLVTSAGTTVVAALHDLNLAAAYCDHVYVLAAGRVVADGPPYEVLTPELVREVFGVDAHVTSVPGTDAPHLILRPAAGGPTTR
ncbi:ABC transporter ATP-binding protein [Streptosporangium saharense]|uniref:Iron complex transport system ATP-binding protein n=1 Tax=Streptosporangium saharense TaxID=1706840 RepID=A0A7W7QNZ0_9ACTN|nr:ABC transporter ATP-binding protein [Streptosporangium saharense]MBB4916998.1 iron complex transport system ATP-binding protein [Streptosporangium saharense]